MNFNLEEETVMMKDSAARYLKEKCPVSSMKITAMSDAGYSVPVYKEMSDMGWLGLIYEEKYGGSGGSFFDLFVLFEEMGKVLLKSPFYCSAVMAGLMIQQSGNEALKNKWLPAIIGAEKILTVGLLDDSGMPDYEKPSLKAIPSGSDTYRISGSRMLVPYANIADAMLVCARIGEQDDSSGTPTLFLIDCNKKGLKKTPLRSIDEERTFFVAFDQVAVAADDIVGAIGFGKNILEEVIPKMVVLKCGEMLGGLERTFEMTIDYAKERKQFGKPLASLQVIQHYCVDMYTNVETARLISYQAASLLSDGISCAKEVAMAKSWCSEAYKKSVLTAHEIHGAIGFCEEHDLGMFYKHAKVSELDWGGTRENNARVSEIMGM